MGGLLVPRDDAFEVVAGNGGVLPRQSSEVRPPEADIDVLGVGGAGGLAAGVFPATTGRVSHSDPSLEALRRVLDTHTAQSPDLTQLGEGALTSRLISSWMPAASRFGGGASPLLAPPGRATPIQEHVAGRSVGEPGQGPGLASLFQMGARFRDFGEGKLGVELYAEVEFHPDASDSTRRVRVSLPSGEPLFDKWVLESSHRALEQLGSADGGVQPSVWGFRGRVVFMRSLRDVTLKDDAAYLAGAVTTNLLTGRFDEMSGVAEYVDIRRPKFTCTPQYVRPLVPDAGRAAR